MKFVALMVSLKEKVVKFGNAYNSYAEDYLKQTNKTSVNIFWK